MCAIKLGLVRGCLIAFSVGDLAIEDRCGFRVGSAALGIEVSFGSRRESVAGMSRRVVHQRERKFSPPNAVNMNLSKGDGALGCTDLRHPAR